MTKNKFYFLPRILAILFIVFISLFALDVFGEPHWFLALLMHLIPSYILIILTIIAWRNEKIGGILFLITAVLAAILLRSTVPIVLIPTLVIGVLFLVAKTNHRGNP
jgi:hypothetical protein